jgi:hypothetical protein
MQHGILLLYNQKLFILFFLAQEHGIRWDRLLNRHIKSPLAMDPATLRLPTDVTSSCHPASPVLTGMYVYFICMCVNTYIHKYLHTCAYTQTGMKGDTFDDNLSWPTSGMGRCGKTANARKNLRKTLLTADDVLAVERALDQEAIVCAQRQGVIHLTHPGSKRGSGSVHGDMRGGKMMGQSQMRVPVSGEYGSSNPVFAALLARWDCVRETKAT